MTRNVAVNSLSFLIRDSNDSLFEKRRGCHSLANCHGYLHSLVSHKSEVIYLGEGLSQCQRCSVKYGRKVLLPDLQLEDYSLICHQFEDCYSFRKSCRDFEFPK